MRWTILFWPTTFGNWREGQNDDLVLAIACAEWSAENVPVGFLGAREKRRELPQPGCEGSALTARH
jgi:hypothetical protein